MASQSLSEANRDTIETFIADWMTDNQIPGAAVAVVNEDTVLYTEGFGARTLEENEPVTPRTLFGMGSCTKTFTATAVMQLIQRNELSVSAPVNDFLPHLSSAPGDPITIRELLSHTSGLPTHANSPLTPTPTGLDHSGVPLSSRDDFRRHVEGAVDRRVTDRETFFYYNPGYTLLGLIVEEITGQSIADYITENILRPLGMNRSTFSKAEFEAEEDRSIPYVNSGDGPTTSEFPFDDLLRAAGGLISSVEEMAIWVQTLLKGGSYEETRILDATGLENMTTPVSTMFRTFDGRQIEYGYGVMIQELLEDRLIGHGGTIGVSNAYFGYLENANLGIAIACSTRPEAHIMAVGGGVLAILQEETPAEVTPHHKFVAVLERACGQYAGYPDITDIKVERDGGLLRLVIDFDHGTHETVLLPDRVDENLLVCKTTDVDGFEHEARFEFDEEGASLYFHRDRFRKVT